MMNEKDTAKAIVSLLDESTSRLDQNITSRLAEARVQAVSRMGQSRHPARMGLGATFMDYMYHHRAVSSAALAFSALLVAFVTTQQLNHEAEGQGDAFLLASELPPEAFLDKEFHTWLEESSQR